MTVLNLITAFDVQGHTCSSNAFFVFRSFEGVTAMGEGLDETQPEMEPTPLSLARRELSHWCGYAMGMIPRGDAARAQVCAEIITDRAYLSEGLARRLSDALAGCSTADEVHLVFMSVQEHQLAAA